MRKILSITEMAQEMTDDIANSKRKKDIYKVASEKFKAEQLSQDIGQAIKALNNSAVRVNLNDAEDVRQRIIDYLTACQLSGTYPSVQGLATKGFGISRQWLNMWRLDQKNKGTESLDLIEMAYDLFADIITNQSLHNNANGIQALFQLKNNHSFADRVEIEPIVNRSEDEVYSAGDIAKRYAVEYSDDGADVVEKDNE